MKKLQNEINKALRGEESTTKLFWLTTEDGFDGPVFYSSEEQESGGLSLDGWSDGFDRDNLRDFFTGGDGTRYNGPLNHGIHPVLTPFAYRFS